MNTPDPDDPLDWPRPAGFSQTGWEETLRQSSIDIRLRRMRAELDEYVQTLPVHLRVGINAVSCLLEAVHRLRESLRD